MICLQEVVDESNEGMPISVRFLKTTQVILNSLDTQNQH